MLKGTEKIKLKKQSYSEISRQQFKDEYSPQINLQIKYSSNCNPKKSFEELGK